VGYTTAYDEFYSANRGIIDATSPLWSASSLVYDEVPSDVDAVVTTALQSAIDSARHTGRRERSHRTALDTSAPALALSGLGAKG